MSIVSPVFNRPQADEHCLAAALEQLKNSSADFERAMAANFMFDGRVSEKREQRFLTFCRRPSGPIDALGLQNANVKYFKDTIRTATVPDFELDLNRNNAVPVGGISGDLSPFRKLVRFIDVNGLDRVFYDARNAHWASSSGAEPFEFYPSGKDPDSEDVQDWIGAHLDNTETQATAFVTDVLELLNARLKGGQPFQPAWVTLWDELKDFVRNETADCWLERLGVAKNTNSPHWIIGLVYPVGEARQLWRPTILDTSWYPQHFPSPPDIDSAIGGHPMDLGSAPSDLIREFIHRQIPLTSQHFIDSGHLRGIAENASANDLVNQRKRHRALLASSYKDLDPNWVRRSC